MAGARLRGARDCSPTGSEPINDLSGVAPERVDENVSVGLQGVDGVVARRTSSAPSEDREADHQRAATGLRREQAQRTSQNGRRRASRAGWAGLGREEQAAPGGP